MADQRIIVALDVSTTSELKDLVAQIPNKHCRVKIGKELFTSVGPLAVDICHAAGLDVFLDLKFHDIPNTCAKAVLAAARLGVWMTNVHCAGGADMMRAAREILDGQAHRPLLIGVTVLTSMSQQDLLETGVERDLEVQVDHLARLAQQSGLDGVVSSAQETQRLRQSLGDRFCLVTPGIRPSWSAQDDQTRIVTPSEAIKNGSDYLVIGRPITASADPEQSIAKIIAEL
ncbi:MAG: orotidine-5'-phosphate decarboxylase [Litoricola sp.]|nr:orotidine-5'-phosphate decarboxylase [Litorivicinus sp.]